MPLDFLVLIQQRPLGSQDHFLLLLGLLAGLAPTLGLLLDPCVLGLLHGAFDLLFNLLLGLLLFLLWLPYVTDHIWVEHDSLWLKLVKEGVHLLLSPLLGGLHRVLNKGIKVGLA